MTTTKIGTVTLSRRREYRLNHENPTNEWGALAPGTYDVVRDDSGFIYWEGTGKLVRDHVSTQKIGDGLFRMQVTPERTRKPVVVRSALFDAAGFADFLQDNAAEAGITFTPVDS